MRAIVMRENAFRGLKQLKSIYGPLTLWAMLCKVFDGDEILENEDSKYADWLHPELDEGVKALRAVIEPDLLTSLHDDDDMPEDILHALMGEMAAAEIGQIGRED